ncbi:hypothetical protein BIV25_21115 [Streptomyces sp. MUSC 14]|uniref:hypothetical protein n=1 Tax=Streptomyces sp. MUSC 14 TaxID=1354889 RepID=UPI0008F5CABE|nr:hypothetical protein [Streptomyces sp. MUSC 14]OIJ94893.1 hypothetical protein BIV25_21115 [Streptomyces sp. MUSC 14]
MTDDVVVRNRLAALLPEAEAQEMRDCWDIGEQEAGLGLLVAGLLAHQLPISETARAQISVLAETWGERELRTPQILRCRGDDARTQLELIERADDIVIESSGGADVAPANVLVPWITCTRCGHALMRTHTREPWGGLSYLAENYVITSPESGAVLRSFPADSAGAAFAALLTECAEPTNDRW